MFHGLIFSNVLQGPYFDARTSGAYRVATELRQLGWDIEVIDFFYSWSLEELKLFLKAKINDDTKFIGFSHLFPGWSDNAEQICEWIKLHYPHMIIISGSAYFSDKVVSKHLDYLFQGYSEYAIVKMFEYLFSNGQKPQTLRYKSQEVVLANEHYLASPFKNPLIIYEDRDFLNPNEWLGIEFSRGCIFRCAFCSYPILGVKGDRTRDACNVELQLKDAYDRFGITHYVTADETFNDRTEKITKFADVVETLTFKPTFSGFIRPDLLIARSKDREELLRMNFLFHSYGVESFNFESAKSVGKFTPTEKMKEGLIGIRNYFENNGSKVYRGTINLIYGLPFETEETLYEGFNWLVQNWQGQSYFAFPLNIIKRDLNVPGQKYNIAKFTQNYEEYGYREMDKKRAQILLSFDPYYLDHNIAWENDHTDSLRILGFTKRMHLKKIKHNFKATNFDLGYASLTDSLEDRLKLGPFIESDATQADIRIKSNLFARDYVIKKLSTI